MIPSRAIFEKMLQVLGADTTSFNGGSGEAQQIQLYKEAFTPSPTLLLADLVEADFDGYAASDTGDPPFPQSNDPATMDSLLDITPPLNGFRWETTGTGELPQTIYGYGLVKTSGPTLLCSALLPAPVVLTGVNQSVVVPRALLRQAVNSIT